MSTPIPDNKTAQTRRLIDLTRYYQQTDHTSITEVYIGESASKVTCLKEGKVISGRFDSNIRIDQSNYGAGQVHAHVHGRKGDEIGVINVDGSGSHGTVCRLHPDDAAALRKRGFNIRDDGLVEWTLLERSGLRFLHD